MGNTCHIKSRQQSTGVTRNEIRSSLIKRTSFINDVYLYPVARKRAGRHEPRDVYLYYKRDLK